jgi:membrane-anchored protein YejM (alkaline phosphatase superfamily)
VFYFSAHELYFPDEYTDKHVPSPIGIRYRDMAKLYGKQNYLERYKTSVNYVDSLAKKIITKLEEANDLENTIIIITSDHGHEVNDHNQNTWGSMSNFTDCQIKVPMAIIGSCFNNTDLELQSNNLTTHYDIVPTIMQNFLGITSDVSTYSIGDNLLKKQNFKKWSFATMVLKCSEFSSIMEEKLTIRFNNYGDYSFIDNNNKLLFNKTINMKKLNQSLEHMTRFIKK